MASLNPLEHPMKKSLAITWLALSMAGTASAAVNCNSFPNNTVSGFVNDDVVAIGYTCTIAASGSVNGNLIQSGDGSLVIRGTVNGAVDESGLGDVTVAGGNVGGDISEADGGNVTLRGGSTVNGGVQEDGDGSVSVIVDLPGLIKADIIENGNGGVTVRAVTGSYEGSVIEYGAGSVTATISAGQSFKGGIEEYDGGGVTATVDGFFEGNITEHLAGNVVTSGLGTFKGNSEHELAGTCSNTIVDFQGAVCNLL
jgi:hypothetical protein